MTAPVDDLVTWAKETAGSILDVPQFRGRRWKHVQAVGAKAALIADALAREDGELLIASAWLHDIGYAEPLQVTGFHPLDGARYLVACDVDVRVSRLVANHSGAVAEAALRGLTTELVDFPDEPGPMRDALWACDMTTSPVGESVSFDERRREIIERYRKEHTVSQSINSQAGHIRGAIERTRDLASARGLTLPLE